ncbi:MAG TPA: VIT domain-containing protein [Isosphaeraceae bacterium]|nr:VIT domain-containing protein [Isosphaeraceae bacterium]
MSAIRNRWLGLAAVIVLLDQLVVPARSQGIIIDRRPTIPIGGSFEIREVNIDGRISDQVAEVQVSQTFHNPGSFQLEAEFLFPLPEEGAIQNFMLMVDGRELPGRLLPKDEARRIYEEIVRTKRDPALLEYMGRGLFRTSVFPIPPGADRKVTMRYTQVCKRDRDVIEFAYPLSTQKFTAKPIQRPVVRVAIRSREAIKSVYSPSDDASIDRQGDHEVRVSFERRDILPSNDFRLFYTLADGALGASVLSYRPNESEDGYFLLLASPEVKAADTKPLPKTVIFVLDRSGSMAGKKIEQARNALKTVLNNLRDEDLFNIVVYDDRVETFKAELERYSSARRDEAERFVDNIREGGSTNIDSALKTALEMIPDSSRPSYILFLTDGLPTAGETGELAIADHCRRANSRRARVFCFGVGYDVNARLLDRLSGGNSGTSEYVKPDDNIETHVGRFYSKMTSPVLTDPHVELAGIDINRTYPRDIPDLFDGGQIVWAGRYRQAGRTSIRIAGKVGGERRSFEFPAELAGAYKGTRHEFVERLWAVRRVGDLIDQIDLHGQNRELTDELVALSGKYGILTPYTSFLADERVLLHTVNANVDRAQLSLESLSETTGNFAVGQRRAKQELKQAARAPSAGFQESELAAEAQGGGAGFRFGEGQTTRGASAAGRGEAMAKAATGRQGFGGGMGGIASSAGASMMSRLQPTQRAQAGEPVGSKVRQIGAKTFYWKNNRWIDSSVTPEEDAKGTKVIQLSDQYFELARSQKAEYNQYLSQAEPVTVKLDGKVYHVDPAPKEPAQ